MYTWLCVVVVNQKNNFSENIYVGSCGSFPSCSKVVNQTTLQYLYCQLQPLYGTPVTLPYHLMASVSPLCLYFCDTRAVLNIISISMKIISFLLTWNKSAGGSCNILLWYYICFFGDKDQKGNREVKFFICLCYFLLAGVVILLYFTCRQGMIPLLKTSLQCSDEQSAVVLMGSWKVTAKLLHVLIQLLLYFRKIQMGNCVGLK